jgi:hypothetical protein
MKGGENRLFALLNLIDFIENILRKWYDSITNSELIRCQDSFAGIPAP